MIVVDFLKFFHLSCVMLFTGLLLTNYYMVTRSMVINNIDVFYPLSVWLDRVCVLLFMLMLITGYFLVHPKGFYYNTPWIEAAFMLSALTIGLFFFSMWLKKMICQNRRILMGHMNVQLLFHIVNVVMLVVLFFIIHDAVVKSTIF